MLPEGAVISLAGSRPRVCLRRVLCLVIVGLTLALLVACGRGGTRTSASSPARPLATAIRPVSAALDPFATSAPEPDVQAEPRADDRPIAPDFEFTTFDGERLSLADFKGQAVVLNFWASWCPPCRVEMPYFETTYRAYQDRGVIFIGLAIQDDPEASRAFLEELGITYPNGPDEGDEINRRYGLFGLPMTVFITRDGKVAQKWTGQLSEEQLIAFVEEIAP